MSYFFSESAPWFNSTLCCRYLVVRFGRLQVPMWNGSSHESDQWHWALGFFPDGQFEVLGAWRDEGEGTSQRIAADLHDRGVERIKALAGDHSLVSAMGVFRPKSCRPTAADLAECSVFGRRTRQAIRWTEKAAQQLQGRISRVARAQIAFAGQETVADFLAQAFQRADRDLLLDRWDRKTAAPYGREASALAMAAA